MRLALKSNLWLKQSEWNPIWKDGIGSLLLRWKNHFLFSLDPSSLIWIAKIHNIYHSFVNSDNAVFIIGNKQDKITKIVKKKDGIRKYRCLGTHADRFGTVSYILKLSPASKITLNSLISNSCLCSFSEDGQLKPGQTMPGQMLPN